MVPDVTSLPSWIMATRSQRRSTTSSTCRDHVRNGTVSDTLYRFVDHGKRDEEPLPWVDRKSETIVDGEIKLCRQEDAVKEVFQLGAIDFSQLAARDHLDVRQQIGGVVCRICNA
jgi:hypothetical protein